MGALVASVLVAPPALAQSLRGEPVSSPEDVALAKAKETGQPVEVAGRTSETTKLSAVPDGQFELDTSPMPVRVKRDGVFHDADLTLQQAGTGISSRMSVNGVTFGAGGSDVLATMTKGDKTLTLTWSGGDLPAPVLDRDSATYAEAGGTGIDVVVRSTPAGWSHYVVVKTPEAARNPSLAKIVFGVRGSGVTLQERPGNRVVAVDGDGKEVFAAPAPLMWEGATPPGEAASSKTTPDEIAAGPGPQAQVEPMDVEVTSGTLALVPNQALLTGPDTSFPIVIDPSWQTWNGGREADGDGNGDHGAGWAYVDQTFPTSSYWKPDRLPTGREVEDYTDKRSYVRMDASPLHVWSGSVKVEINTVDIMFDTLHAWSCTSRDVRLFNVGGIVPSTTWNSRPDAFIPDGAGWDTNWLASAPVNVGRPECGDSGTSNNVKFSGANLPRLLQWATDHKWDIFTLGLFPDKDYNDTHTWKVMDVDPRMVVKFSRYPMPAKDVHMKSGGTTKYACARGSGRPWVGTSKDRTLHAQITDYDGDNAGEFDGQLLAAQYQIAPLNKPEESWYRYSPPGAAYQKAEPDGYLHASTTMAKGDETPASPDGGTTWAWRVRGEDDTALSGPWSAWCEFTIDGKRPNQPAVSSAEYPGGQTSGYDAEARKYKKGTFAFAPGGSGDVVKFHWKFSDGTEGTKAVAPGASWNVDWTPTKFGWQWLEVTALDRAGNLSPVRKYEFGVEQPPRDAGWAMDEADGNVARAVSGTGTARPNADLVFSGGATLGEPGNLGAPVPADRSVRFSGSNQYGEVAPVLNAGPDGSPLSLVDTSKRFMFSTWVKLASTSGDQVVISQAAADGNVFELGWIGGRWTFRQRKADGTVVASAVRDMDKAGDGTPWTAHWVSLMGGYDPIQNEIWLRTQAEGEAEVCLPDQPWDCTTQLVMGAETVTAPIQWQAATGAGALLFGATFEGTGRGSYLNGWVDDSQLWPLDHPDESVLKAIYYESVQDKEFAGRNLRLVNVNSGHCLDVVGADTASGADVIQWTCNAGPAQNWVFADAGDGYYTVTNPNSGKCLDVDATDGSGTADGRNVWQYDCNSAASGQKWKPEKKAGGYWLKSKLSGKCLAVGGGSQAPGGDAVQWTCLDDPLMEDQLWNITSQKRHELHGVTYRLSGATSGKCLEVGSGSTADMAPVMQWACNGGAWQDWKFTDQGNGYYTLTNVNTLSDPRNARCLEVAEGGTSVGAEVRQATCDPDAAHQMWKVAGAADDGASGYRLIAQHSGMIAEPKDGSAADGALIVQNAPLEPPLKHPHQVWKLGCLPDQAWRCSG